ncbi:MAG: hypothetical protein R2834_22535 [Rhodothermales bacterium]
MKTCIDCASTETTILSLRKDATIVSIERVCTTHLLRRIEWMNRQYPDMSYEARIRADLAKKG